MICVDNTTRLYDIRYGGRINLAEIIKILASLFMNLARNFNSTGEG